MNTENYQEDIKETIDSLVNGQIKQMRQQIDSYGVHNFFVDFIEWALPYKEYADYLPKIVRLYHWDKYE
jgi:hypothetical protein